MCKATAQGKAALPSFWLWQGCLGFVSDHNAFRNYVHAQSPDKFVPYLYDIRAMLQGPTWLLTCTFSCWSWDFPQHPCRRPFPKAAASQKKSIERPGSIVSLQRDRAVTPGSSSQPVSPSAFLLHLIPCSFTAVIILGKCNTGHRSPLEAANCCWNEAIWAVIERNAADPAAQFPTEKRCS